MKALIVDDDAGFADLVAFTLRREGFDVLLAYDGKSALERWKEEDLDIIILDVNLPAIQGFSVCRQIRQRDDVPIIMLTNLDHEDDIVHGLEVGADDYIQKPFSPRQLIARIHVVLRRTGKAMTESVRHVGELKFDANRRELVIDQGKPITLTNLETRLLGYLLDNFGRILEYDAIITHVWGPAGGNRDMLRQLVFRLRNKIEADPSQPKYIENLPGLGYGLTSDPGLM
jgi:DNA-binding response OmpR family regulator